ncbi:MAG TPA: hypothetical protein VF723_09120 [Pyrinomonadaceae bacterium]|jgi:hypothetical protein
MRKQSLAAIFTVLMLAFFATAIRAATEGETSEDTDTRIVKARVTEVADGHISVIARSGVEHVIAVDRTNTEVMKNGEVVALKDVHEGDIITIELDEQNPVKFARNILLRPDQPQVARVRR